MPHGEVAWTEDSSRETYRAPGLSTARSSAWTYDSFVMEGYEYTVAKTPEAAVVGMSPVHVGPLNTTQAYWLSTVEVDDIDAAVARTAELGAAIIRAAQGCAEHRALRRDARPERRRHRDAAGRAGPKKTTRL